VIAVNERLTVRPGERFLAILFTDRGVIPPSTPPTDFGVIENDVTGGPNHEVLPAVAMSDDEKRASRKAVGTLLPERGLPVQLATRELIVRPRSRRQLERFLRETGGKIILTDRLRHRREREASPPGSFLVRLDPKVNLRHLRQMRELLKDRRRLFASSADVLAIYTLALAYRMNGYEVGVNPRLQYMARPVFPDTVRRSFKRRFDVNKVWSYMALWDRDRDQAGTTPTIPVAFLDQGFAPNADFRTPLMECDMENGQLREDDVTDISCATGVAVSPPTTGNSFFGRRSWHGNGVVTVAGGIVNN
jgi:hypothetical protein